MVGTAPRAAPETTVTDPYPASGSALPKSVSWRTAGPPAGGVPAPPPRLGPVEGPVGGSHQLGQVDEAPDARRRGRGQPDRHGDPEPAIAARLTPRAASTTAAL